MIIVSGPFQMGCLKQVATLVILFCVVTPYSIPKIMMIEAKTYNLWFWHCFAQSKWIWLICGTLRGKKKYLNLQIMCIYDDKSWRNMYHMTEFIIQIFTPNLLVGWYRIPKNKTNKYLIYKRLPSFLHVSLLSLFTPSKLGIDADCGKS